MRWHRPDNSTAARQNASSQRGTDPTGSMRSRRRDDAKAGVSADNPPMVDGVNEWEFRSSGSWA
jgi:hypothetical protein